MKKSCVLLSTILPLAGATTKIQADHDRNAFVVTKLKRSSKRCLRAAWAG